MTDRSDGKPGLKQRQMEFVRKHGFTFKSYLIALIVLPPAAIYIAFKINNWPLAVRALAAAAVVLIHAALLFGVVGWVISQARHWLA